MIPLDPNPIIIGKKSQYRKNELVNLTCTSPPSLPAAQLTVLLNDKSITASTNYHQRVYYTTYEHNLSATSVNIQFPSFWLNKRDVFACKSAITHQFNSSHVIHLVTKHKESHAIQLISGEDIFYSEGERFIAKLLHIFSIIIPKFINAIICVSQ